MAKRLKWTNEELNCYGFWVLTDGIDLGRFNANPMMLYNHLRVKEGKTDEILPPGNWKDWRKEKDGSMTGEPVFDLNDPFAVQLSNKVEGGFITGCSPGIRILELSDDPKYLKPGQTRPTVIRCELREVSICDIPANPNAAGVVLYDDNDNIINLSAEGEDNPLPFIHKQNNNEMKLIATNLGLSEGATEAEVLVELTAMKEKHNKEVTQLQADKKKAEDELAEFKKKQQEAETAEATNLVDQAVKEGKITAEMKPDYLELCATDFPRTKKILASLPGKNKLGDLAGKTGGGSDQYANLSWDELDRQGKLADLKANDPDLYEKKYKEMAASIRIKQ